MKVILFIYSFIHYHPLIHLFFLWGFMGRWIRSVIKILNFVQFKIHNGGRSIADLNLKDFFLFLNFESFNQISGFSDPKNP